MSDDRLYIGIKGHVVCLDKCSGQEIWRTHVKNSLLTNVVVDGAAVFAYAGGHLFGLDADSGAILWENELHGLGYGYCIIAGAAGQAAATTTAHAIEDQRDDAD